MSDEKNTVTVDLVALAKRGDVHDALQELASKACKADLTALEHAFRAGWAARSGMAAHEAPKSQDAAWAAFVAGEMKAFET